MTKEEGKLSSKVGLRKSLSRGAVSNQQATLQPGPRAAEGVQAIPPPSTPLPAGEFLRDMADATYVGQRDQHAVCGPGRLCPHSYHAMHDEPQASGDILLLLCIARLSIAGTHGREHICGGCLRGSRRVLQQDRERIKESWGLKWVSEASNSRASPSIHPRYP